MRKFLMLVAPLLILPGCTWVKLDKKGENVAVVQARYVKSCRYMGQIIAKVFLDVGGVVQRSRHKVKRELETLARNDAATMGGDTIVIASPVTTVRATKHKKNAQRSYKVYRCGAR